MYRVFHGIRLLRLGKWNVVRQEVFRLIRNRKIIMRMRIKKGEPEKVPLFLLRISKLARVLQEMVSDTARNGS